MSVKFIENTNSNVLDIIARNYRASIDINKLIISVKNKSMDYDYALSGSVNYKLSNNPESGIINDVYSVVSSYTVNGSEVTIRTEPKNGIGLKKHISLSFLPEYFTYTLSVISSKDIAINDVNYGTYTDESGAEINSKSSFEEIFIWCPDRYQTTLPCNETVEIRLSTTRMPDEGFFRGDVGKYLAPAYIAAFKGSDTWMAITTMEIPSSRLGLHAFVTRESYKMNFSYTYNLTAKKEEILQFPKVGFFFSDVRDDLIRKYVDVLFESGLAKKPTEWVDWWQGPIYCNYADQVYHNTIMSGIMKDEPGSTQYCNEEFIEDKIKFLEEKKIPCKVVIFDFGWMDKLGDYNANTERFPDLRGFIDRLREKGIHVLLWFAPFFCESDSKMAIEHPDWFLKNRDGSICEYGWMKRKIYTPDFTNPEVRAYFREIVRKQLSSEPGCFNADGFKIDGYSFLPGTDYIFHDASWGMGDLFQYKADKLIFDLSKEFKPDALIENSIANPLFNDTQNILRLNDASSYDTDLYENRAWVGNLSGAAVADTDDWSAFKKMFVHSTLRKSVYGIPALYAIKYRGTGRMGGASGGYPVPVSDEDYARVSSILRVYTHSPIDATQERFVDPEMKIFWRKYTSGKLAGFYSAVSLAGNTVLAAYTEKSIRLAAIVDSQPVVPIPAGFTVKSVKEIHSDGSVTAPKYCSFEDNIVLFMKASTGTVDYYEIELG